MDDLQLKFLQMSYFFTIVLYSYKLMKKGTLEVFFLLQFIQLKN